MRLPAVIALFYMFPMVGSTQRQGAMPTHPEEISLLADHEVKEGGTLKLRDHVEIVTASATIYADEADYNPLTGEVDARGHVHITLKKAKPKVTIKNPYPEDLPAR
jgi:lipopolysaccharide assembly outer membrane protein LptD (OstA)